MEVAEVKTEARFGISSPDYPHHFGGAISAASLASEVKTEAKFGPTRQAKLN